MPKLNQTLSGAMFLFAGALGLSHGALAESNAVLSQALDETAARIFPVSLGPEFAIDRAEVDEKTLHIILATEKSGSDRTALTKRVIVFFASSCHIATFQEILRKGGAIQYDVETPDGLRPAALRLTATSCNVAQPISDKELRVRRIFERLTANGLEHTLRETVENDKQQLIFDGVILIDAKVEKWSLDVQISLTPSLGNPSDEEIRRRLTEFVCRDHVLRTLVMLGARLDYYVIDDIPREPVRLRYRECRPFA